MFFLGAEDRKIHRGIISASPMLPVCMTREKAAGRTSGIGLNRTE